MPFLRATGLGDYAAMAEVARMRLQDLALLPLGAWPTARAIRDKAGYEAAVRDHIGPILAAAQAEAEALLAGLTVARERARVAERQSDRAGELVMGGDAVVGHGSLTQRIVR